MNSLPIRRFLRLAAALAFVATVAVWAATGAHRGWTKTQITEMQRDEITGIDFPVTRDGFVAGVDVLGLGLGAAAVLVVASFLVGRPRRSKVAAA